MIQKFTAKNKYILNKGLYSVIGKIKKGEIFKCSKIFSSLTNENFICIKISDKAENTFIVIFSKYDLESIDMVSSSLIQEEIDV